MIVEIVPHVCLVSLLLIPLANPALRLILTVLNVKCNLHQLVVHQHYSVLNVQLDTMLHQQIFVLHVILLVVWFVVQVDVHNVNQDIINHKFQQQVHHHHHHPVLPHQVHQLPQLQVMLLLVLNVLIIVHNVHKQM